MGQDDVASDLRRRRIIASAAKPLPTSTKVPGSGTGWLPLADPRPPPVDPPAPGSPPLLGLVTGFDGTVPPDPESGGFTGACGLAAEAD